MSEENFFHKLQSGSPGGYCSNACFRLAFAGTLKGRLDFGVSGNVRHDGIRMGPESGLEFGQRVEIEMARASMGAACFR